VRINPFKPGSPVPIGMFAGRVAELKKFELGFLQARAGEPMNFLITGDRGIGKSSLLLYQAAVARGQIESWNREKFRFCVVSLQISEKTDVITFLKALENSIRREVGKTEVVRKFLGDTWEFIQRVKVMDSSIDRAQRESQEELVLADFCQSFAATVNRITQPGQEDRRDGLIVIIDEADNASPDLRLGYLLKTMSESLQREGCDHVSFVVAGLPETVEKLRQSHESSVRIFEPMQIRELLDSDRKWVISRGIEHANKINVEKIEISDEALDQIALLSEGYPHFIQQFGFSAFAAATGETITNDDVTSSAFGAGGAIETIGIKYYQSDFYSKIKSDEYRQVLKIMAARGNEWVRKSEIRAEFNGNEGRLSNAIQALTSRRIIQKDTGRDGVYRLQQRGFALWIQYFGDVKP